jgi:osmoprotectant transport system permease protein
VTITHARASRFSLASARKALSLDRLGLVIAIMIAVAMFASPFVTFRANRIVSGEARMVMEALPTILATSLIAVAAAVAFIAAMVRKSVLRLVAAAIGLGIVFPFAGLAATFVTPPGNAFARVSPALGFWLLVFAFALLAADSLTRLRLGPWARLGALALVAAAIAMLLISGSWDNLSLLKEYATRADSFWREARQHVLLAFGSLAAAVLIGLPIGLLCHRVPAVKGATLQVLNIVQTVPSIALFGILMVPLGLLATNVPLAAAMGIRGIGAAPALVALFLYALLPVVANAVVGLEQVPAPVVDAARGMGLSKRQRLFQIELPLAFPVILTGIRIVLVQNLGLATIAALIGGGGFGTFIFQGVGQTAMDLVLLGAIPTVALAFSAAVILDAVIDLTKGDYA